MKRTLIFLLLLFTLLLTACTDGPLVATATPVPTPEPTPEPTLEIVYQEDIFWPEEGMALLLPRFTPMLDVMTQKGDETFFAAFTEPDSNIISTYLEDLKEAGFTVIEEDSNGLFVASMEGTDGLLKVHLFYDSGSGTLQISDKREEK